MTLDLSAATGETAVAKVSGSDVEVCLGGIGSALSVLWGGGVEGRVVFAGRTRRFFAHRRGDVVDLWLDGNLYRIEKAAPTGRAENRGRMAAGELTASMPGMVVRVLASEGGAVKEGDGIIVLESMKMQLTLCAPRAGVVRELKAVQGTMVEQGAVLARIDPEEPV